LACGRKARQESRHSCGPSVMPRLAATPLQITSDERRKLEMLERAHSTPQQLAMRARIVLTAAEGIGVHETARQLDVWAKTVRRWRGRWNDTSAIADLAVRLADAPRPGVTPKFTAEQICAIPIAVRFANGCRADSGSCGPAQGVALACEPPEAVGIPIPHWSQSELARQAVARGIVSGICHSSVGRFLKRS
jgi:putative transposase